MRNLANSALSAPRPALTLRLRVALDELQRAQRAERIKQLREESPYTQEALSDKLGITVRAYQAWEEGGGIKWENLENLAEIHSVDIQWIHRGQERGPTPDPFASADLYKAVDVERAIRMEAMLNALLDHFGIEWVTPEAATKPKKPKGPKKK